VIKINVFSPFLPLKNDIFPKYVGTCLTDGVVVAVDPDAAGLHLLAKLQSSTDVLGQDP
jgi:hypothetical protein